MVGTEEKTWRCRTFGEDLSDGLTSCVKRRDTVATVRAYWRQTATDMHWCTARTKSRVQKNVSVTASVSSCAVTFSLVATEPDSQRRRRGSLSKIKVFKRCRFNGAVRSRAELGFSALYRVAQTNWHTVLYTLTSSNIDRFSHLFHCQNQENICNNTVTKRPTSNVSLHYLVKCQRLKRNS